MKRDSFVLFTEQKEIFDMLTDEEAGKLIKAIYHYVDTREVIKLDDKLQIAMITIKQSIDKNFKKWEETKEKRSNAGKKGMDSRWGNDEQKNITNDNNVINVITNDNKNNNVMETITNITDNVNVNVNDNVNVNVNNNKNKKYFENEEVNRLFLEYLELRKSMRVKNTDRAVALLTNKLNPYSDEIKKQMLEESIEKSWRSVYPPKNAKRQDIIPDWLGKENNSDPATQEEEKEMEKKMKEMEDLLSE